MKKVLIINGSKRKYNTYKILKNISEILTANYNMKCKIINLGDYYIKQCKGCETCITKDFCPIKDEHQYIIDEIKSSDALIIGTPVYLRNISSTLKTFCDRACKWYHRSEITGYPVLGVITTAFSGIKQTNDYLSDIILQWGGFYSGAVKRKVMNINNPVETSEINTFISRINKNKSKYKPTLKQLIEFQTQRILAKKLFYIDRKYWTEKGWIHKNYFFECRINLIKLSISKLYSLILDKVIPQRISI